MLNLRTQGLNNAAAVLGGYDAMVKAGLPVETGTPKAAPAPTPAPVANKVQPVPSTATKSSQTASARTAAKTKPAKRRKVKTKH